MKNFFRLNIKALKNLSIKLKKPISFLTLWAFFIFNAGFAFEPTPSLLQPMASEERKNGGLSNNNMGPTAKIAEIYMTQYTYSAIIIFEDNTVIVLDDTGAMVRFIKNPNSPGIGEILSILSKQLVNMEVTKRAVVALKNYQMATQIEFHPGPEDIKRAMETIDILVKKLKDFIADAKKLSYNDFTTTMETYVKKLPVHIGKANILFEMKAGYDELISELDFLMQRIDKILQRLSPSGYIYPAQRPLIDELSGLSFRFHGNFSTVPGVAAMINCIGRLIANLTIFLPSHNEIHKVALSNKATMSSILRARAYDERDDSAAVAQAERAISVLERDPCNIPILQEIPRISKNLRKQSKFPMAKELLTAAMPRGPDELPEGTGFRNIASLIREMAITLQKLDDYVGAAAWQVRLIGIIGHKYDRSMNISTTTISKRLRERGEFSTARTLLEVALDKQPNDPYFLDEIVRSLIGLGDYTSATPYIVKLMDIWPPRSDRKGLHAETVAGLTQEGKDNEAEALQRLIISKTARSPVDFRMKIDEALDRYDYVGAAQYIERFLSTYPRSDSVYKLITEVSRALRVVDSRKGQSDRLRLALRLCHMGLSHRPDDVFLHTELARSYVRLGEYNNAIKHAKKVSDIKPNDDHSWMLLSIVFRSAEEFEKAVEADEEGLKRFPNNAYLLKEAAETCISWKKYDRATKYTTLLIEHGPNDEKERAYELHARALRLQGEYQNAMAILRLGLALVQNAPSLYLELAENSIMLSNYPKVVEYGKKVARFGGRRPELLRRITHLSAELRRRKEPSRGKELCEAALLQNGDFPSLLTEMLECCIDSEDYLKAARYATKILETLSDPSPAYNAINIVITGLQKNGHIREAIELLRACITKEPDNTYFTEQLTELTAASPEGVVHPLADAISSSI